MTSTCPAGGTEDLRKRNESSVEKRSYPRTKLAERRGKKASLLRFGERACEGRKKTGHYKTVSPLSGSAVAWGDRKRVTSREENEELRNIKAKTEGGKNCSSSNQEKPRPAVRPTTEAILQKKVARNEEAAGKIGLQNLHEGGNLFHGMKGRKAHVPKLMRKVRRTVSWKVPFSL